MNKKENIKKGSSPRAVVGDLPLIKSLYKKMFSLFKTARSVEDSRQRHSGMTLIYEQHAFTLIELLVVVLIIGILAAIALPQYQKAVLKTKYARLKPLVRAIADAEEVYYLSNGKYTVDVGELSIDWPETPSDVTGNDANKDYVFSWGYCSLNTPSDSQRVICGVSESGDSGSQIKYGRVLQHSGGGYAGMQRCSAYNTKAHDICKAESRLSAATNGVDDYYW